MPHLLRERPVGLQIVLAGIVPALFGAITGWALGVNEIAYIVLSVLGIGGGYLAGMEHRGAGEGAIRGVIGGALFGGFILLTAELLDKEHKAHLPDPEILLVAITTAFGVVLGALGGRARVRREAEGPKESEGIDFKRMHWAEFIGFAGSAVLLGSLFLPWFSTSCESKSAAAAARAAGNDAGCNAFSNYGGRFGEFTAFETYGLMDILLVMACIAPFVLAYLVISHAQLSWRPGEVTMIIGMIGVALILLNGIILGRPGDSVEIGIEYGYIVGLFGASMILAGGLIRQALGGRTRKPPGVM
jgi:hypothetical protein